jgi:hypothetical protein
MMTSSNDNHAYGWRFDDSAEAVKADRLGDLLPEVPARAAMAPTAVNFRARPSDVALGDTKAGLVGLVVGGRDVLRFAHAREASAPRLGSGYCQGEVLPVAMFIENAGQSLSA